MFRVKHPEGNTCYDDQLDVDDDKHVVWFISCLSKTLKQNTNTYFRLHFSSPHLWNDNSAQYKESDRLLGTDFGVAYGFLAELMTF